MHRQVTADRLGIAAAEMKQGDGVGHVPATERRIGGALRIETVGECGEIETLDPLVGQGVGGTGAEVGQRLVHHLQIDEAAVGERCVPIAQGEAIDAVGAGLDDQIVARLAQAKVGGANPAAQRQGVIGDRFARA